MLDPRTAHRNTAGALGLLLAFAAATSGCIADETILEPNGSLEQLTATACEEFITEGVVAELTTGETCRSLDFCGYSVPCSSSTADCAQGEELVINEVTVLECPFDPVALEFVPPMEHEPWTDCEAALRDGHSGQACGAEFTCGRVAGACCVELAGCGISYPDLSDDETGRSERLIRLRACTPDCQNLTPDESAFATDCASAYTQEDPFVVAVGRRCSGDFVCMNGVDLRGGGVAQGIDFLAPTGTSEIAYCQGGIVLGRGYQPPTIWWLR